jgi:uncharacterized protein (UPF0548 family)
MMRFRRPEDAEIRARLARAEEPYTYAEVNRTFELDAAGEADLASRYVVDRYAFPMGHGRKTFERTTRALFAWRHFEVPWIEAFGMSVRAEPGQAVATLARVLGVWFLNPCRVVHCVELDATANVAGFSYGTLAGHAEIGEEQFRVRLDPEAGNVTYEILAFSRPALWAVRLASPLARRVQRRFAAESAEALARATKF